jgi:integrase
MTAQRLKITKRVLDGIGEAPFTLYDTDTSGLRVRRQTNGGVVAFELRYRVAGRDRLYRLGTWGAVTIEGARTLAKKTTGKIADGMDPQAQKQADALAEKDKLTVAGAVALYLEQGAIDKPDKRASSWERDRIAFDRHLIPLLGKRRLDSLTSGDLSKWQYDVANGKTAKVQKTGLRGLARVTGGKGTAARGMLAVSAMMAWCVRRKLLEANPARDVARYQTGGNDRFLSEAEGVALWQAVADLEAEKAITTTQATIFRLLALTGARRGEIVGLRWGEVDLKRALLLLPPLRHKSGRAVKPKAIPLPLSAVALIQALLRTTGQGVGQDWLFPKTDGSGPIEPPKRAWGKVIERAGLTGVRMHDLRHTVASWAVGGGASLPVVAKLLGHASTVTTQRYAHLVSGAGADVLEAVANVYQGGGVALDADSTTKVAGR